MSGAFHFPSVGALPIVERVTDANPKTIVDATESAVIVAWFQVNEVANATPNLTVDIYDGTNAHYLGDDAGVTWVTKAVAAKTSYRFTYGIIVPKGSLLRVTSSAGGVHVIGVRQRQI